MKKAFALLCAVGALFATNASCLSLPNPDDPHERYPCMTTETASVATNACGDSARWTEPSSAIRARKGILTDSLCLQETKPETRAEILASEANP